MITDGLNPLNLLTLIALVLGPGAAAVLALLALILRRPDVVRLIAKVALAGVAAYVALFLVVSLASRDRSLALSEEKHICEVDCHLAYSVLAVHRARTLAGRTAQGMFYVVTVRVRFDESTIAPHRGMGPLTPNSRYVAIIDRQGRRYGAPVDALKRPLTPGASYTTEFVFDLPPDAQDPRLILASADAETRWVIGHENGFFHGKTLFRLEPRVPS
jgi:hypothetical protein